MHLKKSQTVNGAMAIHHKRLNGKRLQTSRANLAATAHSFAS